MLKIAPLFFQKTADYGLNPSFFRQLNQIRQGRAPGQVIIQFTDQCNASCAQCGMRRENAFDRTKMNVDTVKKMLDSMAAQGVNAVSFTGGEPLLYLKDISECIKHARSVGIQYVRTGTNGFIFQGHQKPKFKAKVEAIAETLLDAGIYTFWISIDSKSVAVHENNRGLPDSIAGIEKAVPIFHQMGLYPSANLGINRYIGGEQEPPKIQVEAGEDDPFYQHFKTAFAEFYQHVEALGFTIVNACYPMNYDDSEANAVYTATSTGNFVYFTQHEKIALFKAMRDVIPKYRHRLRIFTPISVLNALINSYLGNQSDSYACRGGIDFFFIDAMDNHVYPCGFRGDESLGSMENMDISELDRSAWCKECDWECFRDPSQMLGPLIEFGQSPVKTLARLANEKQFRQTWLRDVAYYRACQYFDATKTPDYNKLNRFKI